MSLNFQNKGKRKMWSIVSLLSIYFVSWSIVASTSQGKDCTPKPTDLVFVLDESGSVGEANFVLQNEFVAKFVEGFNIGRNATQVAVITFSTAVKAEFYLDTYHDKAKLMESIKHINYSHPGLTMTQRALASVRTEILTLQKGMRSDALPFVIVMTDGKSMSTPATLAEAKKLHAMNVTVYAIGISSEVNENELQGIASKHEYVIIVKDFSILNSIRGKALTGACEAILKKVKGDNATLSTKPPISTVKTTSTTTTSTTTTTPSTTTPTTTTPIPTTTTPTTTTTTTTTTPTTTKTTTTTSTTTTTPTTTTTTTTTPTTTTTTPTTTTIRTTTTPTTTTSTTTTTTPPTTTTKSTTTPTPSTTTSIRTTIKRTVPTTTATSSVMVTHSTRLAISTRISTTTTAMPIPASNLRCDFQNSACGFLLHLPPFNTSWIICNASSTASKLQPIVDHTFKNSSGQFLYIDGESMEPNKSAYILSPLISDPSNNGACLQFHYQMFGNDTKTLNVYITNGSISLRDASLIWSKTLNETLSWYFAEISLNLKSKGRVIFEGIKPKYNDSGFAIDDISATLGKCPNVAPITTSKPIPASSLNCDFESSACGFLIQHPNTSWTIRNGSSITTMRRPKVDHTFQNSSGQFLYTDGSAMQPSKSTYILSPLLSERLKKTECLQFYYQIFGNAEKTLNVYTTNGSISMRDANLIWSNTRNETLSWDFVEVPLNLGNLGRVIFEGVNSNHRDSGFAIDDITTTAGKCPMTTVKPTTSSSSTTFLTSTDSYYLTDYSSFSPDLSMSKSTVVPSTPVPPTTSSFTVRATNNIPLSITTVRAITSASKSPMWTAHTATRGKLTTKRPTTSVSYSITTSTKDTNSPIGNNISGTKNVIPGWFQFIEIGLLGVTAITGIGLLGCCCLKFFGGKRREEDDDDDEYEEDEEEILPSWKQNHRLPASKPGGWTDGLRF